MEIKNLISNFSTSLETSMLHYIFAVIATFSIYALNVYATVHSYIGFGIAK